MSVLTIPANASGDYDLGTHTQVQFAGANSSNNQVWLEDTGFLVGYGGGTPITVSTPIDVATGLTRGTQCNFDEGPSEPNWNPVKRSAFPCMVVDM